MHRFRLSIQFYIILFLIFNFYLHFFIIHFVLWFRFKFPSSLTSLITDRRRDNILPPTPVIADGQQHRQSHSVHLPFPSLSTCRVFTYLYCFFRYRVRAHSDDAVKIQTTERRTIVSVYKTVSHVLRGDEEIPTTEDFDQWDKSVSRTTNKPNCVPSCCLLCVTTLLPPWVEHFCCWLFFFLTFVPQFDCRTKYITSDQIILLHSIYCYLPLACT